MSSERLSRNEAVPTSPLLPRKPSTETQNRRGTEEERQHPRFRRARSSETKGIAAHRYTRFVPTANVTQLLLDLVLIGGSQAAVFSLIRSRLDLSSIAETVSVVGFSTLISLILLYSTGCYSRDALIDRAVAISRVPTALMIAGITLFVSFHYGFHIFFSAQRVFLSISRCVTIVLIGTSISLVASIVSRNINRALLHAD